LGELTTKFDTTNNEITTKFKYTSDQVDTNCFTGYLEAIRKGLTPKDMTTKLNTIIDIVDGEISFTLNGDEINDYCVEEQDSPDYNCVFAFRILYG
jgi:hypothetical protein